MRRLVAETTLEPRQLILPMFIREGAREPIAIKSMPGVVPAHPRHRAEGGRRGGSAGLGGVMLFGVPESKDEVGSGALDPTGILNVAIRDAVARGRRRRCW